MKNIKEETIQKAIISDALKNSYNYGDYRSLVDNLADQGKTTGPEQKPSLVEYTRLNSRRMKRWDKTFKIPADADNALLKTEDSVLFLVITESWCGDAAPSLPIMNKLAENNDNISLKIVLRDENESLMKYFHTDGAHSIPKLIMLNPSNMDVLGTWGPRPSKAAEMVRAFKLSNGSLTAEFKEELQLWYNKDKGQNIWQDLENLLSLK